MNPELKSILVDDLELTAALLKPAATLTQAGFDSLTYVELSAVLADRHGIAVTETELQELDTLADLETFIGNKRAGAGEQQKAGEAR